MVNATSYGMQVYISSTVASLKLRN